MATMKLSLQAVEKIDDGRIAAAFNLALEKVVSDLDDRGEDKQARAVTLTVTLTPVVQEGMVEDIDTEFKVVTKIPPLRSRVYRMQPAGRPTHTKNQQAPEKPEQGNRQKLKEQKSE